MYKPYVFHEVNGREYLVMTLKEWQKGFPERTGIVSETSRLHLESGWPVGTKTSLYYDAKHGTCLAPVAIEG